MWGGGLCRKSPPVIVNRCLCFQEFEQPIQGSSEASE